MFDKEGILRFYTADSRCKYQGVREFLMQECLCALLCQTLSFHHHRWIQSSCRAIGLKQFHQCSSFLCQIMKKLTLKKCNYFPHQCCVANTNTEIINKELFADVKSVKFAYIESSMSLITKPGYREINQEGICVDDMVFLQVTAIKKNILRRVSNF